MAASYCASVSVDANGNTTALRGMSLGYDTLNRLLGVNGATYAYNALNQRVAKTVNGVSTNYTYGLNGELLSEASNDPNGNADYVYLNGAPLAVIRQGNVYYVHTDQLGTPRSMTDANQKVIWRWDSDPFGMGAANEDPDGDGVKVTLNLRFAGQYFDQESGLHYNYRRYYDPQSGRYVSSDPIGLGGGLNTYGYVGGNPTNYYDPNGLMAQVVAEAGWFVGYRVIGGLIGAPIGAALSVWAWDVWNPDSALTRARNGLPVLPPSSTVSPIQDNVLPIAQSNASSDSDEKPKQCPDLPKGLVGDQSDPRAGQSRGKRHNSGPLLPGNGGTGNAETDFDKLTGGTGQYDPNRGHTIGDNGIRIRPGKSGEGPRIDIPANGAKPPETLHY